MNESVTPSVYLFGPFRLEVGERRLLRDGEIVPLAGKAFDTLRLLVEGARTLQKQESLMDRLWPDVVVEQNNLQYNVSLVRRAVAGAPGIEIQTVRGQGYRLVADVQAMPVEPNAPAASRVPPRAQRTHFAKAHDGARLAYAFLGDGPPLVKAANWLSHVEMDWHGPIWTHWLELLSRRHCLIRYDARGNGLSDWDPPSITFEDFVADLGAIFDAAAVKRAPLLGISQGAAVAADGSLWLTQSGGQFGRLQQIDAETGRVMASYTMPAGIEDIEFGPDGRLWALSEAGAKRWNTWPTFFPVVFSLDMNSLH